MSGIPKPRLSTEGSSEVGSPGDHSNSAGQASVASGGTPGDVIMSKALATVDGSTSGSTESSNIHNVTGTGAGNALKLEQSSESTSVNTSIPLSMYSASNNIFTSSSGTFNVNNNVTSYNSSGGETSTGGQSSGTSGDAQSPTAGQQQASTPVEANSASASAQQSAQNQYSNTNANPGASYGGYQWQ